MATASVPYTFLPNTLIDADQANANLAALVGFLNSQVMHRDASAAFSNVPSGPAVDPVSANQLTRKAYVDTPLASLFATNVPTPPSASMIQYNPGWTLEDQRGMQVVLPSVPNSGIIIPATAQYRIGCKMDWSASTSGSIRAMELRRGNSRITIDARDPSGQTGKNFLAISLTRRLTAGDVLNVAYRSDHSGGLNVNQVRLWAEMVPGTAT